MECREAEGFTIFLHEYLLLPALEKALHLPCPQLPPSIPSPTP